MLVDRYGKTVEIGEWFIRLDQNNEGRLYLLEGHAPDGRIKVHEHAHNYKGYISDSVKSISPVRLKQTIKKPSPIIWYPQSLLPELKA